jgi:hypothetical protein
MSPMIDDSGEFVPPAKTYLDDIEVYDDELGGLVPAWKSILWHGVKARRMVQLRADSAGAVDAGEAGIEQPPPLVADAIEHAKTDLMLKVNDALKALGKRMTKLECAADERDLQAKAEKALELTEDLAEIAPKELLTTLADRIDRRLH